MEPAELHGRETAGQHLVRRVPLARSCDSAKEVLAGLTGRAYDTVDAVYVVGEQEHLLGVVPLTQLLSMPGDTRMEKAMVRDVPCVRTDRDQEQVCLLAIRHDLTSVPVVDHDERFLGVVPGSVLLGVLRREHTEDIHRLAGVLRSSDQAHSAMEASPWTRALRRLPWLLVGVTGSAIATAVMVRFERILEARIAVAFFIPAIVYLADAVGTQTEAIVVRYLSSGHAPLLRLVWGELLTGLLIGLSLSLIVFPSTLAVFGDVRLATAVTVAVAVAGLVASTVGLIFPWALSWLGKDPAFGSGPVATVIQDVLSLLIYFAAILWFVK
jgi:magnesium transporter